MKFVIFTQPFDVHAAFVSEALSRRGHEVISFGACNFPDRSSATISFSAEKTCQITFGDNFAGNSQLNLADVIWLRRQETVQAPTTAHNEDKEIIDKECRHFINSLFSSCEHVGSSFWVNAPSAKAKATNKALQLAICQSIGFRFPETIMTNDGDEIIKFYTDTGKIIYKSFGPIYWTKRDRTHSSFTTILDEENIYQAAESTSCPGIYQRYIEKKFEVRVTSMGDNHVAVRLNRDFDSEADWRVRIGTGKLIAELLELPKVVSDFCTEFKQKMGLEFGCFDFVVDLNDDWFFLEVNEQGQFLWVQEINGEIPMLAHFVNFLESPNSGVRTVDRHYLDLDGLRPSVRDRLKDQVHWRNLLDEKLYPEKYI